MKLRLYILFILVIYSFGLFSQGIEPIQIQPSLKEGGILKATQKVYDAWTGDTVWYYAHDSLDIDALKNGFDEAERDSSVLGFNNTTLKFYIRPVATDFKYWDNGVEYTKTAADSIQISNVSGLHVFYYEDDTMRTIANPTTQLRDIVLNQAIIAYVYWNADSTNYVSIGDERHGNKMSSTTHLYLHQVFGAQYLSGMDITDITVDGSGNSAASAMFGVSSGYITDEDLRHTQPTVEKVDTLAIYYRSGTNGEWWRVVQDSFRVYNNFNGLAYYNQNTTGTTWQLTRVTSGRYLLMHLFATNDTEYPQALIVGQNQYTTVTAARAAAETEMLSLKLGALPEEEFVPIATFIFQTATTYNNRVKSRIISTDQGDDYIDWRFTDLVAGGGTGGSSQTFLDLTDTPSSYSGEAGKYVRVNGTSDGLEFATVTLPVDSTTVVNSYGTTITESPANQFNVKVDTSKIATLFDLNSYAVKADSSKWTVSGTNLFPKSLTYDVGIGLNNPAQQLELTESFRTPMTTTSTTGVWYKGVDRFAHNFKHPTGQSAVPDGDNTFLGISAGNFTMGSTATNVRHGSYNVGIGRNVLVNTTTGYDNAGLGAYALEAITTGYRNLGIGTYALYGTNTGYENVGVGVSSLYSLTEGFLNTAIGRAALFNITTQDYNTAIGGYAGFNSLTQSSLFLGYSAGYQTNSTTIGNGSVVVGAYSGTAMGSGTNNVLLGYDVELALPNASNQTNLANVIYTTGNATGSTPSATGRVGIGTSTPVTQFHTTGTVRLAGAGTPGSGKVLTSDSDGTATWQTITDNDTQDLSIDSLNRVFTVSLVNGGSVKFQDTNTQLTEEQVEDYVGGMVTGNTETGITVTYEDSDGTIDFVATDASTTNEIEVVDETYNATNFNGGTTTAVSQDDFYDFQHTGDTDDDALVDKVDLSSAGFVKTNASGVLSVDANTYLTSETGDISAVSATAPLTGGGTSGAVTIGITQSGASSNGYLSSTDWTTFNNKYTLPSSTAGYVPYYHTGGTTLTSNAGLTYASTGSLTVKSTQTTPNSNSTITVEGDDSAQLTLKKGTTFTLGYGSDGWSSFAGTYSNSTSLPFNIRNSTLKKRFEYDPETGILKLYKLDVGISLNPSSQVPYIVIDAPNRKIGINNGSGTIVYGNQNYLYADANGVMSWNTPTATVSQGIAKLDLATGANQVITAGNTTKVNFSNASGSSTIMTYDATNDRITISANQTAWYDVEINIQGKYATGSAPLNVYIYKDGSSIYQYKLHAVNTNDHSNQLNNTLILEAGKYYEVFVNANTYNYTIDRATFIIKRTGGY